MMLISQTQQQPRSQSRTASQTQHFLPRRRPQHHLSTPSFYYASTSHPDESLHGAGFQEGLPSQRVDDTLALADVPRSLSGVDADIDWDQILCNNMDGPRIMASDASWLAAGPYTPKSGRMSHQRESSLSSLGSAGPASPYSQNTSNPQIAVTDSSHNDSLHGLPYYEDPSYQLVKPLHAHGHEGFYPNTSTFAPDAAAFSSLLAAHRQTKGDHSLLPPPELSAGTNRSRPVSVASSVVSDSPATPSAEQPDEDRRRKQAELRQPANTVPKLDRTMTDVYSDELFSPNFSITSATPSQSQTSAQGPSSPSNDMFVQRLQAINSQHLSAAHSSAAPSVARDKSPFRNGSPLAPLPMSDFSAGARYSPAQPVRDQRNAQDVHQALQAQQRQHERQSRQSQQQQQVFQVAQGPGSSNAVTPQTISPKDAVLDFHESEVDNSFPLFPNPSATGVGHMSAPAGLEDVALHGNTFGLMSSSPLPSNLQIPQQYPFISHPRQATGTATLSPSGSVSGSSRMGSLEASSSPQKPMGTTADGGTYTCTYHGCTLRFESPALLQKHKREGHRQTNGLGVPRKPDVGAGMTSAFLNTQAGPHKCERINPSTGKPCNTIFSRPYDLTRHEDTIHNARKQKVRCNLCTEEKTFSRADALTRHYRVCHPDVDFPGKHRRRGAA